MPQAARCGAGPPSGILAGAYPFVNQSYLVDIASAGVAGGNGGSGTGTPGDSVISFNGNSFTGGGGGGALTTTNVPSAGGAVLNTNHTWLPNIPAATQSPGNVSGDGTFTWKPFGGAGGGGAGAPGGVGNPGGNGNAFATFGAFLIDILEYTNTNKYKTLRNFGGFETSSIGRSFMSSGFLTTTTNAITQIDLSGLAGGFMDGTEIALYGIKAAA